MNEKMGEIYQDEGKIEKNADRWLDGLMNGYMDRWADGRTDGQIGGWMHKG